MLMGHSGQNEKCLLTYYSGGAEVSRERVSSLKNISDEGLRNDKKKKNNIK